MGAFSSPRCTLWFDTVISKGHRKRLGVSKTGPKRPQTVPSSPESLRKNQDHFQSQRDEPNALICVSPHTDLRFSCYTNPRASFQRAIARQRKVRQKRNLDGRVQLAEMYALICPAFTSDPHRKSFPTLAGISEAYRSVAPNTILNGTKKP